MGPEIRVGWNLKYAPTRIFVLTFQNPKPETHRPQTILITILKHRLAQEQNYQNRELKRPRIEQEDLTELDLDQFRCPQMTIGNLLN